MSKNVTNISITVLWTKRGEGSLVQYKNVGKNHGILDVNNIVLFLRVGDIKLARSSTFDNNEYIWEKWDGL